MDAIYTGGLVTNIMCDFRLIGIVGPGMKIADKVLNNRPCIQSRIQASTDPIVLHLPKSRILEFLILKHTTKWRLICYSRIAHLPSSIFYKV